MRISDWSSDVFSSDLCRAIFDTCWLYLGHASELPNPGDFVTPKVAGRPMLFTRDKEDRYHALINTCPHRGAVVCRERKGSAPAFQCMYHGWVFANTGRLMVVPGQAGYPARSEEHTSELQSLMRISYAVFCLKKKKT